MISRKGIEGMKEYWGHALSQEGAGYTTSATNKIFRLDIHECPSKGFLIRNGLEQHADYCDHCIGWIGPMLKSAGFDQQGLRDMMAETARRIDDRRTDERDHRWEPWRDR